MDLEELGYGTVTIRDPKGAAMNEHLAFRRKHEEAITKWQAHQLKTYVVQVSNGGVMPGPASDLTAWIQFVSEAPSKVISRLLRACAILDRDDAGNS